MKKPSRFIFALLLLGTACSTDGGCDDGPETSTPADPTPSATAGCSTPRLEADYLPEGSVSEERKPFAPADHVESFKVGNGWVQVLGGVADEWTMAHTTTKDVRGTTGDFGPVGDDGGRTIFVLSWKEKTDCGEKSFAVVGALLKAEDYVKVADALRSP